MIALSLALGVTVQLRNDLIVANLSSSGLTSLTHNAPGGLQLLIANDSFAIQLLPAGKKTPLTLTPELCTALPSSSVTPRSAVLSWRCNVEQLPKQLPLYYTISANYSLPERSAYISKTLRIESSRPYSDSVGAFEVRSVALSPLVLSDADADAEAQAPAEAVVQHNPWFQGGQIAAFARFPARRRGLFVSVANPFATYDTVQTPKGGIAIGARTEQRVNHTAAHASAYFDSEALVLGFTTLGSSYDAVTGLNTQEAAAFRACVQEHLLDRDARERGGSVKVNVAWDESDYQIDVGTQQGIDEYKRIIERSAQIGVTHVVYGPRNTRHSTRSNFTDGWGWEGSLWFSMGERLREGSWSPLRDDVPDDVVEFVQFAKARGVGLLAYVYPCLAFEEMSHHLIGNTLDTSPPEVQAWLTDTLLAFLKKSGAAGFAWDHDIFAGDASKRYAQWRAWMGVLRRLRDSFPDMLMDHRQTNHMWGPWYQLAGSYAEPIAGDENPETYGVRFPTLSTDHVAADNMRAINYVYATQQLMPPARMPGFIFHQTERTDDNGTSACFGNEVLCYDMNTRDFDLMGFKYSLLSSIGTAGLNNVFASIPARDAAEYELLPSHVIDFISSWLQWTDAHAARLANLSPIVALGAPALGRVDGTSALLRDEGFIFLFNPSAAAVGVALTLDESVGVSNASSARRWALSEVYPRGGLLHEASVPHGAPLSLRVGAMGALVLELRLVGDAPSDAMLLGARGVVRRDSRGGISLQNVTGVGATSSVLRITGAAHASVFSVNGVACTSVTEAAPAPASGAASLRVTFGGPRLEAFMPALDAPAVSDGAEWLNGSVTVDQAMLRQLRARQRGYPIAWTPTDERAAWLAPARMLLSLYLAAPRDSQALALRIDGAPVAVQRAYNSRGVVRGNTFIGFFADLSSLDAGRHELALQLPDGVKPGEVSLFWQNVADEDVDDVDTCELLAPPLVLV